MNKAEELVDRLCTKSFLSLWSYPNPQGKDPGKELCDILVVCEPDVIIFSVKEVGVTDSGDVAMDWKRWLRRAVRESVDQIYGAERWIGKNKTVIARDGTIGLTFPDPARKRTHRVAVALGSQREVPIPSADFGKGIVHVFDETALDVVMTELDTITDFIKYLRDKEALRDRKVQVTLLGGEEDLLALYLRDGREFPRGVNGFLVDHGLWADFSQRQEYRRKKEADESSYLWDRLIELICEDFRTGKLSTKSSLEDVEQVLRTMAREDRFSRRVLSKCFLDFMKPTRAQRVRSRHTQSPSGVPYVFLARPHDYDRNQRRAELASRCFVVRGLYSDQTTVIGIATEQCVPDNGSSFDVVVFEKKTWTADDQRVMESMQTEMGYFAKPVQTPWREDEYPTGDKH